MAVLQFAAAEKACFQRIFMLVYSRATRLLTNNLFASDLKHDKQACDFTLMHIYIINVADCYGNEYHPWSLFYRSFRGWLGRVNIGRCNDTRTVLIR